MRWFVLCAALLTLSLIAGCPAGDTGTGASKPTGATAGQGKTAPD